MARTRSSHVRPALGLLVVLLTGACYECDYDVVSDADCGSTLGIRFRITATDWFTGDQITYDAFWTGPDAADCPTNFTWSATGNALQLLNTTGPSLTVNAVQRGPYTITAVTGPHTATLNDVIQRTEGDINVSFTGLASGAVGNATLTGPGGRTLTATGNSTFTDQPSGAWGWAARDASSASGHRYTPNPLTGLFNLDRNRAFGLTVPYNRQTAQGNWIASGVPSGTTGNYGFFVNGSRTQPITADRQTFVFDPGTVSGSYSPVLQTTWNYRPQITTASLTVAAGQDVDINVPYTAANGQFVITVSNLPQAAQATATIVGGNATVMPVIPGSWYRIPDTYMTQVNPVLNFPNTATNRFEDHVPEQSLYTSNVFAGLTTTLDIGWGLSKWRQRINMNYTIVLDLHGHHNFVFALRVPQTDWEAGPLQFEPAGSAAAVPQPITIRGAPGWVTLTGTLEDDLTFTASGSGTVAGFPNVPVLMTGTLAANGTLTAQLRLGQDTPPTGLPNGSITYNVSGTRASPAADRGN